MRRIKRFLKNSKLKSGPLNISLEDQISSKQLPVVVVGEETLPLSGSHPELAARLSILSEKSENSDTDSDHCHSPESFDSGHPVSPTRNFEENREESIKQIRIPEIVQEAHMILLVFLFEFYFEKVSFLNE